MAEILENRRGAMAVYRERRKGKVMADSDVRRESRSSALNTVWTGDAAVLALRLAVGVVLAYHGWLKLQDVSGFAGFVELLGIPAPDLMAYVVTYLEFFGGAALIVGLATRYLAALFVVEMVFTNVLVKFEVGLIAPEGVGAELDILILAIALSLVLTGAGRWSVDAFLSERRQAS